MACKIKREVHLEIYDDKEGYESWKIGGEILLILKDKELKYGAIEDVFAEYLILNNEFGMFEMIKFSDIEGYCSLIKRDILKSLCGGGKKDGRQMDV